MKIADTSAQDVALPAPSPTRRRLAIGAVLLGAVLLATLAAPSLQRWAGSAASVPRERLRLARVLRADLVRDVSVQGRVVAAASPSVFAPAAGTVTLLVEAGAAVSEGQLLARLDSPQLQSQLEQEQATLDRLGVELDRQRIEARQKALENRKQVDLTKIRLAAAERERRRAENAYRIEAISEIDFEKTGDDLDNATLAHAHAVADAGLDSERLAFELKTRELQLGRQSLLVEELRRQVGALELRSPVDGVVGNLMVDQRAAVARDQVVMAVVDLSAFELEARVPESYAEDLDPGMEAEVRVGERPYGAVLVAVSPEIVDNQLTTRIRFTAEMPPGLKQNQRLGTRILMEKRSGVLTLQRGPFLDGGGGRIAYVLDDENVARRRFIETGARSLAAVEITSGLNEGEEVVISSIDGFQGADSVLLID